MVKVRLRYFFGSLFRTVLLAALFLSATGSAAALELATDLPRLPDEALQYNQDPHRERFTSLTTVQGPITVRTTFAVGDGGLLGVSGVELAALAAGPDRSPLVSLEWRPAASDWGFIFWEVALYIAPELRETGSTEEGTERIALLRLMPTRERLYEVILSFDPEVGDLSILLLDRTESRVLYRGRATTQSYREPLCARAALWREPLAKSTAALSGFAVYPVYLPVGVDWSVGINTDAGRFLAISRFDFDEDLVVNVAAPDQQRGRFRLLHVSGTGTDVLTDDLSTWHEGLVVIPATRLSAGSSVLRLEYVVKEQLLYWDVREIVVGRLVARFEPLHIDREQELIHGSVAVSSQAAVSDVQLYLDSVFYRVEWDAAARDYVRLATSVQTVPLAQTGVIGAEEARFAFSLPLPQEPGYWELTVSVRSEPGLRIDGSEVTITFTTYQPAALRPGDSFAIAVLPDTQYYAKRHPVILQRQLQWIAEQAVEQRIVLTLHLGDLTNDNEHLQWTRVAEAFALLDGVMPYMIAQGNHDMTASGGGQVADRDHSLINEYFSAAAMPWVQGTYPQGRIENSFGTFTFQGESFLVISLEFGPSDEALAWANRVVEAHPDHTVIMITHANLNFAGLRSDSAFIYPLARNPNTSVNGGVGIWHKFTSRHPNLLLTLSGHIYSQAIPYLVAEGVHGNRVFELLVDYQGDPNGGNGYLAILEFHPDGTIEVRSYSPYLGQPRTDVDLFGFTNHFIIDRHTGRIIVR